MADISKIQLPDETEYNIKDASARSSVANLISNLKTILSGTEIKKGFGPSSFITADGAVADELPAFTLYGKSTQSGTPTPTSPVDIVTAGSGGSVGIVSCGRNLLNHRDIMANGNTVTITEVENGVRIASASGAFSGGDVNARRAPGTYTLSFDATIHTLAEGGNRIGFRNGETNVFDGAITIETSGHYKLTHTVSVPFYISFYVSRNTSAPGDISFTNIMLVKESDEALYEPYAGTTATLPTPNGLPGIPVSSGGNFTDSNGQKWICDTIDERAGVCVRRIGAIASYAGETLPGVWMSSMDVYAPGGTPNTGASVIYALATPATDPLTAAQIAALDALRSHEGHTTLYMTDAVQPEMTAKMWVDISELVQ